MGGSGLIGVISAAPNNGLRLKSGGSTNLGEQVAGIVRVYDGDRLLGRPYGFATYERAIEWLVASATNDVEDGFTVLGDPSRGNYSVSADDGTGVETYVAVEVTDPAELRRLKPRSP